jgi:hypothetical protein
MTTRPDRRDEHGSDWSLRALTERLDVADLPEQFVLAEGPQGPERWPAQTLGAWTLRRHPSLPCVSLHDATGTQVGWLLGYPVTEKGALLRDGQSLTMATEGPSYPRDSLDLLGGRWAAVIVVGPSPSLHLDATGSLSAVYVPSRRLVASTPSLVPYGPGLADRDELVRAMGLPWAKTSKFPVGMTSREGVWRLLPNHHLDLLAFVPRRHWPRQPWAEDPDIVTTVGRIAELTRRNVVAATSAGPGLVPLTAGRDSRSFLACIRDLAHDQTFFTVRFDDYQGEVDTWLAQRLTAAMGLKHRVVRLSEPRQSDLEEWLLRVGCSVGEVRGWRASTSVKALGSDWVTMTANIGETGRGRRWLPTDEPGTLITPERLLGHSRAPATEETRDAVARWLADVPLDNALQVLSLYYVEDTLGSWAGVIPYAEYAGPGFTLLPMNHTEIIRAMMALPEQFQRERRLPEAIVGAYWPELLRWPFNEETGWRRVRRRARQQARRLLR